MRCGRWAAAGLALVALWKTGMVIWSVRGDDAPAIRETFDADPHWDGFRNRLFPDRRPIVVQKFGYRTSHHAGGQAGEIGGTVTRSTTPALYARPIPEKTLEHPLSASGRLALTQDAGSSGTLIGWFHESSKGWRTPNSLGLRIDGNGGKFYEYGTRSRQTRVGGAFEGKRYQTTETKPYRANGTVHLWSLKYAPRSDGTGLLRFIVDEHEWEPVVVPKLHRADGARFNRFGIWNSQTARASMDVFFDDLIVDGVAERFDRDPKCLGMGIAVRFEDRVIRPFHDFGFSTANGAGGKPGELAGIVFRDERPAYCGGPVGDLTLEASFNASGKVALLEGAADSGIYLGWFHTESKRGNNLPEHQRRQPNILNLAIEGPSRIGHYVRPAYSTSNWIGRSNEPNEKTGFRPPIILPEGKSHTWSIGYQPLPEGTGRIRVHFDEQEQILIVTAEHRRVGAHFDRFGLFNMQSGGHHVRIAVDDIRLAPSMK